MPRRKLSESCAKRIICNALDVPYVGWSVMADSDLSLVEGYTSYVVKVDQAVKGRFKKGLILLNIGQDKLSAAVNKLSSKGYSSFVIEPYVKHNHTDERYLALKSSREGYELLYSPNGGIEIESHQESIKSFRLDDATNWTMLSCETEIAADKLCALFEAFRMNHLVFMEINPYTNSDGVVTILDSAIEVDDAGMYFVNDWSEGDIRMPASNAASSAEVSIRLLDQNSPASFNLSVLDPNGAIFLLLSGGGASVVVADEVFNRGFGGQLANYGEYSGNPTSHETYIYTAEILKLLLASDAPRKVLFIGGAVANFTDIASTFTGVIKAIVEYAEQLNMQGVRIFVRRGGPRQEIGLAKMRAALEEHGLYGGVYDPTTSITDALDVALMELS